MRFGFLKIGGGFNVFSGALTGSLQALQDASGVSSPLQLSTTNAAITSGLNVGGTFANLARLHVRGDGTNPLQRWESNGGVELARMDVNGVLCFYNTGQGIDFYGQGIKFLDSVGTLDYSNRGSSGGAYHRFRAPQTGLATGIQKVIGIESNYQNIVAGNSNFRPLSLEYTINNTAAQTGTATGLYLSATITAVNGMTHNLADLQVNGNTVLRILGSGQVQSMGYSIDAPRFRFNNQEINTNFGYIIGQANGVIGLLNATENGFDSLVFGLRSSLYPMIKRVGNAFYLKQADDIGWAGLQCGQIQISGFNTTIGSNTMVLNGCMLYTVSNNLLQISSNSGGSSIGIRTTAASTSTQIINGVGSPEGVITANVGSIFMRGDGGMLSTMYVKESGTGNTGWVAK
jgi:hypothetical protein